MTTNSSIRELRLCAPVGELVAAAGDGADGDRPQPRRFQMVAYTGGAMRLAGWAHPVVVDLAGMQVSAKSRPILKDHNPSLIVGHTESVLVECSSLHIAGVISGAGAVAGEIVESSLSGFPWQASIGASAENIELVPKGKSAQVNGQKIDGPVQIVRRSRLGEVSFVALGADDDTSAQVAAKEHTSKETDEMEFEAWLTDKGFDAQGLSDAQLASLKAMYEAERAPEPASPTATATAAPDNDDSENTGDDPSIAGRINAQSMVADIRAEAAEETQRIADIRRLCASKHVEIETKAIAEGWDAMKCELEILRADRPRLTGAPAVHVPDNSINGHVLEAACMMTSGLSELDTLYEPRALDVAAKRFRGGIGLQELILEAAWANGYTGRSFRDSRGALRSAFGMDIAAAGLSTINIGGIISNVANKFMLEGFFSVERTWRTITAIRNVSDFKTVTSYRLVGKDQYELVAPGGEFKHGTLGEESYSNKADTYGLLLSIDRRDIINDDLGAITTVPRKLGRGSGLKINDVFWTTFLDNAAFFTAGNNNFLIGAQTALSIDGLTNAETAFLDQVDSDGKPIGIMPSVLLVPTGLSAIGTQLFKSLELRDTTSNTKFPTANPHQGKFGVEVSRYLGNAQFTGNSNKAWYLLADPTDLPVIEVAFLNGREAPTIETAEADFNALGVQMRGYHDFGVNLQDPRGGVKSKGEA